MKTILIGNKSVRNFCFFILSLTFSLLEIHSYSYAASPVRGLAGDLWADTVIGQPSFSEITPYDIVNDKVFLSNGLTVDRSVSPGRLYVYDGGNSRVLGLDLGICYATASARCSAQIVIGQPSFNTSACNGDSGFQNYPQRASASASTLCGIPEETNSVGESGAGASLAVDINGALYVPDYGNSRVLKYNNPFLTDQVADDVWGQDNFAGNTCNKGRSNPDATTLCFQGFSEYWLAGVEVDPQGNVWVADTYNNRVLRFPVDASGSGQVSKIADLVLGQPNFTSKNPGAGLNQMYAPGAIRVSPTTGKVYVAEYQNYRITVFTPPFTSGMTGETFGSNFHRPSGIDFDPNGQGIWINDTGSSMIELWDEQTQTVKKVVGKDVYTPDGQQNQLLYDNFGSIGIDANGNILTALRGSDVLRFSAPIPDPTPGVVYQPDKRLFSPPTGANFMNASGMDSARGVTVSDNQFIVQDTGRILFWNNPNNLTSGKAADGVVEVSDFTSRDGRLMSRIEADANHHLWVLAMPGGDYPSEIWVYRLPLTTGAVPIKKIRFPLPVLGTTGKIQSVGSFEVAGIAPISSGSYVWVSDPNNHRVLGIRSPLTSPMVDVILGQKTTTGNLCNQGGSKTKSTMCYPGAVTLDRQGNLYISDHTLEINGNMRLLEFDSTTFKNIGSKVLLDPAATRVFNGIAGFEPAFDSKNRMVIGLNRYYNHNFPSGSAFPVVFNNLLSYPKGSEVTPVPNKNLSDFFSMAYSATFDSNDNLYMTDINRSRVLIYKKPLP